MNRKGSSALLRRALGSIAPLALRTLRRPSLLGLMYHRVLPRSHPATESEQAGMWVTPETLRMHASVVKEFFEPVFLDDWLDSARRGEALPARAVAFTFDDGWRDNFDFAFPMLRECGIPATIFLVTGHVGGQYLFWPTRLARLLRDHWNGSREVQFTEPVVGLVAAQGKVGDAAVAADAVIQRCKAYPDDQIEAVVAESERRSAPGRVEERSLLNEVEIRAMRDSTVVRFGSHTRTHARLRVALPAERVRSEIISSRAEVEAITERPAPLFCYPNGEVGSEALAVVRQTYSGAVTTVPGWNGRSTDRYLLRRVGMHESVADSRAALLGHLVRQALL
jgi:peptidoglycan/xylan/chitin deacetylase (PgdA/CDA1 family)